MAVTLGVETREQERAEGLGSERKEIGMRPNIFSTALVATLVLTTCQQGALAQGVNLDATSKTLAQLERLR